MAALILGVLLITLKLLDVPPVVTWDWWWVLSPLVLAVAWWQWSDLSGHTSRMAVRRGQEKTRQRRLERAQALGLTTKGKKKGS